MSFNTVDSYSVSLVSGGKLTTPFIHKSGDNDYEYTSKYDLLSNSFAFYTDSQRDYSVVPFNNMLRIYCSNTRQCVKTIKFNNNKTLENELLSKNGVFLESHIVTSNIIFIDNLKFIELVLKNLRVIYVPIDRRIDYDSEMKVVQMTAESDLEFDNSSLVVTQSLNDNVFLAEDAENLYICTKYSSENSEKLILQNKVEKETLVSYSWSSNKSNILLITKSSSDDETLKKKKSKSKGKKTGSSSNSSYKKINATIFITNQIEMTVPTLEFTDIDINTSDSISKNAKIITQSTITNDLSKIALGFASGVIQLLTLQPSNNDVTAQFLKWHCDSILALSFNSNSTQLFSGGWEKVFVYWDIAQGNIKKNFIPRLNGVIVSIMEPLFKENYIAVLLQHVDNVTNMDLEWVLLNKSDFKSKLNVNGPLINFENEYLVKAIKKENIRPKSAIKQKSTTSTMIGTPGFNDITIRSFTNSVRSPEILYFPHCNGINSYDLNKNESLKYIQLSKSVDMGKIRMEHENIIEPEILNIENFQLQYENKSYEILVTVEALRSQQIGVFNNSNNKQDNEISYTLKFWRKQNLGVSNIDNEASEWVLQTKIISPHGIEANQLLGDIKILDIHISGNYDDDLKKRHIFTTDSHGGIKKWAIIEVSENVEEPWKFGLVNYKPANSNLKMENNFVIESLDKSLILQSLGDRLHFLDAIDLNSSLKFLQLDSNIQTMSLNKVNGTIVIMTKIGILSYDLVKNEIVSGFDLYEELQKSINGNFKDSNSQLGKSKLELYNMKRLLDINPITGDIVLAVNDLSGTSSTLFFFDKDLNEMIFEKKHDSWIACLRWNKQNNFNFIDINSRIGIISSNTSNVNNKSTIVQEDQILAPLNSISSSSNENVEIISSNKNDQKELDMIMDTDNTNDSKSRLNNHMFLPLFNSVNSNTMVDTVFDTVLKMVQ
ncbi:hypothetical protein QEN19_001481 [Hanseniaspora menglaensis]